MSFVGHEFPLPSRKVNTEDELDEELEEDDDEVSSPEKEIDEFNEY